MVTLNLHSEASIKLQNTSAASTGFQVQRLNPSAIAALMTRRKTDSYKSMQRFNY